MSYLQSFFVCLQVLDFMCFKLEIRMPILVSLKYLKINRNEII